MAPTRHKRWLLRVALSVAVLFLAFPSALFAKQAKTKVLMFQVQSDSLSDSDRAAATKTLKATLAKYPSLVLLPTPGGDFFEMMMEMDCTDIDVGCLSKLGKKDGAQRVVYVQAEKSGASIKLTLKWVHVAKKKMLHESAEDISSIVWFASGFGKLAIAAIGPVPVKEVVKPVKPKRALVKFTSSPRNATVYVNNKKLGRTPFKRKLKPGKYLVRTVKKGYVKTETQIVVKGKILVVNAELKKTPKAVAKKTKKKVAVVPPPPAGVGQDKAFYTQWWFWTAVGVGVAGIVTTAVVLSIDRDPASTGVVNFGISAPDYDPRVLGAQ
jgi:hypothetical protein